MVASTTRRECPAGRERWAANQRNHRVVVWRGEADLPGQDENHAFNYHHQYDGILDALIAFEALLERPIYAGSFERSQCMPSGKKCLYVTAKIMEVFGLQLPPRLTLVPRVDLAGVSDRCSSAAAIAW